MLMKVDKLFRAESFWINNIYKSGVYIIAFHGVESLRHLFTMGVSFIYIGSLMLYNKTVPSKFHCLWD